jgi:hypothetical protein
MKEGGVWKVWEGWGEGLMARAILIEGKNHTLIQQRPKKFRSKSAINLAQFPILVT